MDNQFKYILEPYGSGRQYEICPSCGHTRYVRYVDTDTGECLPFEFGRCERINNCGYHKSPKELITNPLKNKKMETKTVNESVNVVETTSVITQDRIEKSSTLAPVDKSNILNVALLFFLSLIYGVDKVLEVAQMYRLYLFKGFSKDGRYAIGFPQILNGKIKQIKAMTYNLSGKRVKIGEKFLTYRSGKYQSIIATAEYLFSPIRFLAKTLMRGFEFVNQQTFFGAHLIEKYPNKIIAITESEKTAIIGAIENPEYVWLATGGQYGCKWTSPEVYSILQGHEVMLFPDLKATEDWKLRAKTLAAAGINVSIFEKLEEQASVEDKSKGLDIADFFLRKRIQENPQTIPTMSENEVKTADIPDFDDLFGSSTANKPEPKTSSISGEELPTDEDLKKFDKQPKSASEYDFRDMDKLIGLNADAVADIA